MLHICSMLVRLFPEHLHAVQASLSHIPAIEVISVDPSHSKMIVVLEATSQSALLALQEQMNAMPAVVGVEMIYHHVDTVDSMEEKLP